MERYQILFFDLDGTLLDAQHRLPVENKTAILEMRRQGALIGIASGRPLYMMASFIRDLDVTVPVITNNGALVQDAASAKVLCIHRLPSDVLADTLNFLTKKNYDISAFCVNHTYLPENSPRVKRYALYNEQAVAKGYPCMHYEYLDAKKSLEQIVTELVSAGCVRISVNPHSGSGFERLRTLVKRMPHVFAVPSAPDSFDLMAQGVSKWEAIRFVCKYLSIPEKAICTFGNDPNDTEMLQNASLSFAMANASLEAKAAAKYITNATNNYCGVAEALYRYVSGHIL